MQDLACFLDGSVWSWTIEWLEWWLNVVLWIWVSDLQCDLTWCYIQFWDRGFMFCPCVTIPWQTNGCLSDLAGQGKLQFVYIYIYMYSSLEWFMSPGTFSLFWTCIFHHISWYPWHILYSASSLFRWHPTVAESEVVEMENSTLNRAGVLWEDQDSISAGKKCAIHNYCYHLIYTYRLQIIKQPQLVLLIKQPPSIPLEFFIFPTVWGTVKSTSSPANPSCKVRRTSWHSSEGITFAAEFSAVVAGRASFCGGGICGDRYRNGCENLTIHL